MNSNTPAELRQVAEEVVLQGAQYIKKQLFGKGVPDFAIMEKSKGDFVTNIDIETEKIIRKAILKKFPNTRIMGEEEGVQGKGEDILWFIDPLDGTGAFIRRNYAFVAVSVAVVDQKTKEVLAGAICNPFTEMIYSAESGMDVAVFNGNKFHTPIPPKLNKARILIDFSDLHPTALRKALGCADVNNIIGRVLRYDGSIAQHFCLIANGSLHGGIFWGIGKGKGNFWDIGAALLICQQAGLMVTDLSGADITYTNDFFDQIIAAPSPLHEEILQWIDELQPLSHHD
ncbi:MAG: inositol monophosphatase family protein [Candidatus Hodarchaeales archaeon]